MHIVLHSLHSSFLCFIAALRMWTFDMDLAIVDFGVVSLPNSSTMGQNLSS